MANAEWRGRRQDVANSGRKSGGAEAGAGGSAGAGPVVSAELLASGAMPALSEFEFGMILTYHAFQRWMVRCMTAAGHADLGPLDILVLHSVNHRGRAKRLADICLVLNVEDTHTVTYAIGKLEKRGLVQSGRKGKEKTVTVTAQGEAACRSYHEVRERLLVAGVKRLGLDEAAISDIATLLRVLSGQYDQAARAAAAL